MWPPNQKMEKFGRHTWQNTHAEIARNLLSSEARLPTNMLGNFSATQSDQVAHKRPSLLEMWPNFGRAWVTRGGGRLVALERFVSNAMYPCGTPIDQPAKARLPSQCSPAPSASVREAHPQRESGRRNPICLALRRSAARRIALRGAPGRRSGALAPRGRCHNESLASSQPCARASGLAHALLAARFSRAARVASAQGPCEASPYRPTSLGSSLRIIPPGLRTRGGACRGLPPKSWLWGLGPGQSNS